MKVTKFDSKRDLIIVPGRVWNPRGRQLPLRLVLDTGAAETIIVPEVLDELGYSAREHGDQIAVMRSASGREEGYMLGVIRFACLGFQQASYRVHAQDLPQGWGIDGLVGLSFFSSCSTTR
ncbi:MAG: retropepsin-like domain-containing protein [Actinobacteria bacterium]|nr:retropepsin-like domain-containing protein [Actinomycetota bacterium]